jgi:tyrosine-protein kinase Etk/Wzc
MNPNTNTQLAEDTIDLKELFFTLLAQWKIILACTLFALICAGIYLSIAKKVYSVDAKIQVIDSNSNGLAGLNSQLSTLSSLAGINLGGGQQSIQTEIEILQSRAILTKTIQDLNLDIKIQPKQSFFQKFTADKFQTDYRHNAIVVFDQDKLFSIQHFKIPKDYLNQKLILKFSGQQFTLISDKTGEEVFKGTLNQKLQTKALGQPWSIVIASKQPLEGQYIVQKQSTLAAVNSILSDFHVAELSKQTGIITASYEGVDQQHIIKVLNDILQNYLNQNLETKSAEKEKTLAFLDQQLPQLKQNLEHAEQKFNAFRETHGTIDIKTESELYLKQSVELETQKIQLEQKQAELAAQYTSEHPMMQEINAQISVFDKKINELNSSLKKLPNTQSEYLKYYRDVEVQTQLYTNLLGTYQSLSLAKAGETSNLRVLDYPVNPIEPIKPRKLIILALAIFIGGFIGVLIALLLSLSKTGVKHREEIEQATGIKTYAELTVGSSLLALETLIPTLRYQLQQKQHNVTLLSSIAPDQNQTAITKQLAIFLSQTGQKVLLVDSDLHQGQLDQSLNVTAQAGLSEYLRGQAEFNQVIHNTAYANLSLIPSGQNNHETSLTTHQIRLAQLLQQVKEQYDYVILSAVPILANSDSLNLAQYSGFNLALVQYAKTQLKEIELAKSYFENAGHTIDGIIFDQIPAYQSKNYQYQTHSS